MENGSSECGEIEEINPIQYMMGNLMKKIDENKESSPEDEETTISSVCSTPGLAQPEGGGKKMSSEFERTILESRAARLDADQLKQEQDIQLNESAVLQLKKVRISQA